MKKVYKLLEVRNGKLYPLYVNSKENTEIHVWLNAKCGEMIGDKVKAGKLNKLAFRPGWHTSKIPIATHIGKKIDGEIVSMHDNHVWCECFINDSIDYQNKANENGRNQKGIVIPKKAYLKEIPVNGYYTYKTNPNMTDPWFISGELFVNRVLTDDQVESILISNEISPMKRNGIFPLLDSNYFKKMYNFS